MTPPFIIAEFLADLSRELTLKKLINNSSFLNIKENGGPYHLIGLGKTAYPLALELVGPSLLSSPFIVTKALPLNHISSWIFEVGSHPQLNNLGLKSGSKLISYLQKEAKIEEGQDLFVALTGGASSLVEVLPEGVSEAFVFELHRELLMSGGSIEEVNLIRQEFSCLKNGGLLLYTKAKRIFTFITSDIPSPNFQTVGSSPTFFRAPDFKEVEYLMKKLLSKKIGGEALSFLKSKERSNLLREKEKAYRKKIVRPHLVTDFYTLKERLKLCFKGRVFIRENPFQCEIGEAIKKHNKEVKELLDSGFFREGRVFLSGGETSVNVKGEGLGGRNTEFVLRMGKVIFVDNIFKLSEGQLRDCVVASFATDGTDGETDRGGAWFDYSFFLKSKELGLDIEEFLARNDSYTFFEKLGTLIKVERCEVNIMDFRFVYLRG